MVAADWYERHAGTAVALRFIDGVHAAFGHIAAQPGSGSPRYATTLGAPGLRSWSVKRIPYLTFCADGGGWLDARRVLHAERDLPASLHSED